MTRVNETLAASLLPLAADLPPDTLMVDDDPTSRYSRDWSGDTVGRPLAVARPRSVADVAKIVGYCHARRIGMVPLGGQTGLVGSATPTPDGRELVLSLERLNRVRAVDPENFAMVVEAGCVLEDAKRVAETHDCLLPISLGAQGSCQIGGNVSTNAGGINVLRYGMTRDLVLGLEVVLPDGRLWNGLNTLRKDNRGYDLKQLFIGSEGTLGVVTAAALKLFPKPTQVETALLGLGSIEDAMTLYARARRECSDLLSAFELILRDCVELSMTVDGLDEPLSTRCPVYVLMDVAASGRLDLRALVEGFLADAMERGLVRDGAVATSGRQAARLWRLREATVEAQGGGRSYLRTDVSVPISSIPRFIESALAALKAAYPAAQMFAYGHVGDGNVHLNVIPPAGLDAAKAALLMHGAEEIIFGIVDELSGSISAEHGIGRVKQKAFLERLDVVHFDIASKLKAMLDPDGVMNAGRILPRPEQNPKD